MNVLVQIYKDVPVEITADRQCLEHVISNLLSNAIKFCPDRTDICLSLSYETKMKKCVTIAVRDYGPGISDEDKQQLFQPFMQVRPGELQKGRGSGLGLSICKHLIHLHEGSIDCMTILRSDISNILSGGSEFSFTIPVDCNNIADEEDDGSPIHPSKEMIGIMSAEFDSKHIQYSKCDKERALQVLSSLRMIMEHHSQKNNRTIELTEQMDNVSSLIIQRREICQTKRVLIVDGKIYITRHTYII